MRVTVDPGLCQAYANCVTVAPTVFELDDQSDVAVVVMPEPPPELRGAIEQAVALCPVRAITMTADDDHEG